MTNWPLENSPGPAAGRGLEGRRHSDRSSECALVRFHRGNRTQDRQQKDLSKLADHRDHGTLGGRSVRGTLCGCRQSGQADCDPGAVCSGESLELFVFRPDASRTWSNLHREGLYRRISELRGSGNLRHLQPVALRTRTSHRLRGSDIGRGIAPAPTSPTASMPSVRRTWRARSMRICAAWKTARRR